MACRRHSSILRRSPDSSRKRTHTPTMGQYPLAACRPSGPGSPDARLAEARRALPYRALTSPCRQASSQVPTPTAGPAGPSRPFSIRSIESQERAAHARSWVTASTPPPRPAHMRIARRTSARCRESRPAVGSSSISSGGSAASIEARPRSRRSDGIRSRGFADRCRRSPVARRAARARRPASSRDAPQSVGPNAASLNTDLLKSWS